MTNRYSNITS